MPCVQHPAPAEGGLCWAALHHYNKTPEETDPGRKGWLLVSEVSGHGQPAPSLWAQVRWDAMAEGVAGGSRARERSKGLDSSALRGSPGDPCLLLGPAPAASTACPRQLFHPVTTQEQLRGGPVCLGLRSQRPQSTDAPSYSGPRRGRTPRGRKVAEGSGRGPAPPLPDSIPQGTARDPPATGLAKASRPLHGLPYFGLIPVSFGEHLTSKP